MASVKEADFLLAGSSFFCLLLELRVVFATAFALPGADLFAALEAAALAVVG